MEMSLFDDDYNEHQIAWLGRDWNKVQECADTFKEKAESVFFEILGAINESKVELNVSTLEYNKLMIENALSQHPDCMPAVYAMNLVGQGLSDQAHFNYMKSAVSRGKRYGKWAKLTEHAEEALVIKVLMARYKINAQDAMMYKSTLIKKGKFKQALKQMKGIVTEELIKSVTKNIKEQKQLKTLTLEW